MRRMLSKPVVFATVSLAVLTLGALASSSNWSWRMAAPGEFGWRTHSGPIRYGVQGAAGARKLLASGPVPRATVGPGKIAFCSNRDGNNEIYIMDPDGDNQTRLTNGAANDQMPAISPDGNKIVYSSNHDIWEMNIDGSSKVQLTSGGAQDIQPVYNPDGTKIAFAANRLGDYDVFLMNRDGTNITRLTLNGLGDTEPSWSPAGNRIGFLTYYGGSPEVTGINTDGSNQLRLTTNAGGSIHNDWGPNNKIAFTTPKDGNYEIYTIAADGSNQTRVTTNTFSDQEPAWSRDSSKIAFVSNRSGNSEIYTMNSDGTGEVRITTVAGEDFNPSWGPPAGTAVAPFLSIDDVQLDEGDAGTSNATFTVSLSVPNADPVTVDYDTTAITATDGTDFSGVSGTLTFPPNTPTQTIEVPVTGDTSIEADETFRVELSNATGGNIGKAQGTGTIRNDDAPPMLSVNDVNVVEGDAGTVAATFTVSLSRASESQVTVNYNTVSGTASSGPDFVAASGSLTFDPGETSHPVTVMVNGDLFNEADETFTLRLSGASGATLSTDAVFNPANNHYYQLVAETNNWEAARQKAADRWFFNTRGHLAVITSAEEQSFIVTNFNPALLNIWIGGFQPAGSPEPAGNWQWVTGEPFTFNGWTTGEPNNAFGTEDRALFAGNSWNDRNGGDGIPHYLVEYDFATLPAVPSAVGTCTIDNDDPEPSLSLGDATLAREGNSGQTNLNFTVTLSSISGQAITVDYATANGTAAAPADFLATIGTLTIPAGSPDAIISVPVKGDTAVEADTENFSLDLANAHQASLLDSHAVGTITDDDGTQVISVSNPTVTEGNTGTTNASFTLTLSAPSTRTVTVDYTTVPGTASPGVDYQIKSGTATFTPSQTNQTVSIAVVGDNIDELDESFSLSLSNAVNATIGSGGTCTIVDNDPTPGLSIADLAQAEGNGGVSNFTFNVSLSSPSSRPVTFNFSTSDVGATSPVDYIATSGNLTIGAGATSVSIGVMVNGDFGVEPNEVFVVTLSSPQNATLARSQAIGTILNDDTTTPGCQQPPSGVANWWPGEGNAADISGDKPGTLQNGASFAAGKVGQAFSFDGVDDFVALPANTFPFPTTGTGNTPFTFETWFKTSTGGVILGQSTSPPFAWPTGHVTALYVDTAGVLRVQLFGKNTIDQILSPAPVNDGVFHHVAVMYNGTNQEVYLDGSFIGSKLFTQVAYTNGTPLIYQLGIGFTAGWPNGNGNWWGFNGLIDEPSIYNRALTPAEVQSIFNAGSAGKCRPATMPQPTPTPKPFVADIQELALPTNDLVYDKVGKKIYASVPASAAAPRTSSITPIDPYAVSIGTSVAMGAEPKGVVVTDDGSYVYAALGDLTQIRRFNIATQTASIQYGLGTDYSALWAEDFASVPGHPHRLAVSRANTGISPRHKNVAIFDDGVALPLTSAGANVIEMGSATRMYGYFGELSSFDFVRWNVGDQGVAGGDIIHPMSGYNIGITYDAGRIYGDNGQVFDPESGAQLGNFPGAKPFAPDGSIGKLFVLAQSGTVGTITAYSVTNNYQPLGSIQVPGISGTAGRMIRWGASGLAFRTSGGQVFIINSNLVAPFPTVAVSVSPGTVVENAGAGAATGTVTRSNSDTTAALTVSLASSDTTEATVPASVIIPAGASSKTFAVAAVNDTILDGPQPVTLTPTVSGFLSDPARLTVTDEELSSIRGRVATASGTGLANIAMSRNGGANVNTDANGNYVFTNVPFGNYIIAPVATPALSNVTFTPASRVVTNTTSGLTNINFTAGFSITGTVANSSGVGIPNILVTRSTPTSATSVSTDANGLYRFTNVASGDYTITPQLTPAMSGSTFIPASRAVTVNTASLTNINFTATFSVTGSVRNHSGTGIPNVQVSRTSGASTTTTVTDSNGVYLFTNVRSGAYTVAPQITPSLSGITFTPASTNINVTTTSLTNVNFVATFRLAGRITNSASVAQPNVSVALTSNGSPVNQVLTDSSGNYSFTGVRNGSYVITPTQSGKTFSPVNRSVTVTTANQGNLNFIGSP